MDHDQCVQAMGTSGVCLKGPLPGASGTQLLYSPSLSFATESQVLFFKKLDERIREVHSYGAWGIEMTRACVPHACACE